MSTIVHSTICCYFDYSVWILLNQIKIITAGQITNDFVLYNISFMQKDYNFWIDPTTMVITKDNTMTFTASANGYFTYYRYELFFQL